MGEATLSFGDNEQINDVVNENGMATTVQRMDERLDEPEDLLKSGQLSRTRYPVETKVDLYTYKLSLVLSAEPRWSHSRVAPSHPNHLACIAVTFLI